MTHSGHSKTVLWTGCFAWKIISAETELGVFMDLGGWLRSLGLEQYEAAFRENAIDAEVLPDLTDQDLEKLGVLLGHRRKLLRAIGNLQGIEKGAATVAVPITPPAVSPRVDAAER